MLIEGKLSEEKYKTIAYEKLVPFLIKAVQELTEEINKLKKDK